MGEAYVRLAHVAAAQGQRQWILRPKLHATWHGTPVKTHAQKKHTHDILFRHLHGCFKFSDQTRPFRNAFMLPAWTAAQLDSLCWLFLK